MRIFLLIQRRFPQYKIKKADYIKNIDKIENLFFETYQTTIIKEVIEQIIQSVLDDNKEMVSQYKSGKTKLLGFFVGQVMKRTKGKANPKLLNDLLIKMIK